MRDLKHDTRNYLASIKAVVYLAKKKLYSGDVKEVTGYLDKIDTKVNELNLLLDRIPKSAN